MNQTQTILLEQVSALADGQLDDEEVGRVVAQAGQSGELQAAWHRYHLIGDVLRTGHQEPCTNAFAFVTRLQQRVALEPKIRVSDVVAIPATVAMPLAEAANEPVFRWKLVACMAAVAMAMVVGWGWVGHESAPSGAQLAQTQPVQPVTDSASDRVTPQTGVDTWAPGTPTAVVAGMDQPQKMVRDPRLDELMAAHQQAAGSLQPSVFLRNATFEGPSR